MKKVIYITGILAAIGLIAYVLNNNKEKNEAESAIVSQKNIAVAVRIDTVSAKVLNLDYTANGNFAPLQELSFPAENSGRVVRVLADEGDTVKKGQVLAVIKGDQLSVEMTNAQAAYNNAVTDRQRYEEAFQTGGVTKQQLDQAKLNLADAKARLDQSRLNLAEITIRSSIDGIVNKRYIEPGSVVAPGTNLFDLVNVSELKLQVTVSEEQVSALQRGTIVKVKASVYPDKEYQGKVTFIAPKADEHLNFPVEIRITKNPGNELKAGMYGSAGFSANSSKAKPIVTISRNAFVGGVGSNMIFVVKDNAAKLTKIVSGRIFGQEVEVLGGLKEGDIVVTTGQINLQHGTKVAVIR